MKIVHLTKEIALANINRLIEIDKVLDDSWGIDNFLADFNRKWEYSFIALENEEIVGFLICSDKGEKNIHIHRIAVLPDYQRKKTGAMLIKQLIIDCYKSDIRNITLKVSISNLDAQRFYEKNGFEKITLNGSRYLYARLMNDKETKA